MTEVTAQRMEWLKLQQKEWNDWSYSTKNRMTEVTAQRIEWLKLQHKEWNDWSYSTKNGMTEAKAQKVEWLKLQHKEWKDWSYSTKNGMTEVTAQRMEWRHCRSVLNHFCKTSLGEQTYTQTLDTFSLLSLSHSSLMRPTALRWETQK
jgi:hypothetical protein